MTHPLAFYALIITIALSLSVLANLALDHGCAISGIVTAYGIECI